MICNPAFFIIIEGEIDLVYKSNKQNDDKSTILKHLKPGDSFGELPLFTENPFEETAMSCSFAIVYKISRKDFLEKLKLFPEDLVIFFSFYMKKLSL